MPTLSRPALLLPLLLAPLPAVAQQATTQTASQAPTPDAASDAEAGEVIVTATRQPTARDRIAASVTVLDQAAIDRNQDPGVTEQLLRTPSVSIARNGGYGTNTTLRIRGAETDQTVVVIDGVKLNDPSSTDGSYNFANLLTGDISRIEVLRGPQSTLWGSQAIGGVVNIVTATATRPLEMSFDVTGGSYDTVDAHVGLGGKTGPLTWRIAGTEFYTSGISAIAPSAGGVERDPYRNQSLTGRAEVALSDTLSVALRGYYSHGNTDIDATTGDSPEFALNTEYLGYAGVNLALFDGRLKNRFAFAYTGTERDNYDPRRQRQDTFDAAGFNKRYEYQGSLLLARGIDAQFGADHEDSNFHSVSPPAALATPVPAPVAGSVGLTGVYGQLNATVLTGLTLSGGLRYTHHSDFGGKTLFAAGGVWVLPTGTTIRASYGEGFKAPSLYQLFSQYGNTALQPVQAHGWEAGAEQRLFADRVSVGATYFRRISDNLIIFASCATGSTLPLCFQPGTTISRFGYYQNVSKSEGHGIELVGAVRPAHGLTIDANYSWTVAEDRSPGSATNGLWLPRRPRNEGNAAVTYRWPFGLSTTAAVRWSGHTYDNAANTVVLNAYKLVDLRAEMPLSAAVSLIGRADNIGDEQYQTAYRYGTIGRAFYGGIRGRF